MPNKIQLFPIAMIVACVIIMQVHSIQFWAQHLSLVTGATLSVVLELAAIWLWYTAKPSMRWMAILASTLLIAGPFYQLSKPLLDNKANQQYQAGLITLKQAEIAQLEKAIADYNSNSTKRVGWAARIDRTQARLNKARAELQAAMEKQAQSLSHVQSTFIIVLQLFALFVIMATSIHAVHVLRRVSEKPKTTRQQRKKTEHKTQKTTVGFEQKIRTAKQLIKQQLPKYNNQITTLADHYQLRRNDLSAVKNHDRLLAIGKRTVSEKGLDKIINKLEQGL